MSDPADIAHSRDEAFRYIRDKVNQLLTLMGTLPLDPHELDDETLIALDPIGIIADSFQQILEHLNETNDDLSVTRDEIQKILDSVGNAIVVVDRKLQVISCNQKSRESLFRYVGDPEGRELCELVKQSGGTINRELFERIIKGESESETADIHFNSRFYHIVATPIHNAAGEVVRVIFSYSDISERIETEEKLRQAAVVFENASEAVLITDAERRIIAVNAAFSEMTGYTEDEVLGQNPDLLKSGRHDPAFYDEMWQRINDEGYWRGEIWDRRKNGEVVPLIEAISQVRRADGSLSNYVSIFTDISSLKKSQEQLDFLAYHDPLTQLPNRLLFNDRLTHAIELARREGHQLAVLFIDLDRFKNINDSLGHHVGDQLLVQAAERLRGQLRDSDTVGRIGGDEFIVMLEEMGEPKHLASLCRNLIEAFKQPFDIKPHALHIGLSIGISIYPQDGEDVATLVKHADAAMYQAKEEGRNDFRFFTQALSASAVERLNLELALRRALENGEFEIHYQPLLSLAQGEVIAAEALIRWRHPELGMIPPDTFIPLAEDTGLILPIGEWVLHEACQHARRWVEENPHFEAIAVNISGLQFQRGRLDQSVARVLEETGLEARHLELEITENYLMQKAEQTIDMLDTLKAMGLSLVIDDFGTGYSSLSYLKRFPVDKLKIDRTFIRDVITDPDDAAIARAVIALGHSLSLAIVAEGIEDAEQQAMLNAYGCDFVQGYLYSRPLPVDEFETFLERHRQGFSF